MARGDMAVETANFGSSAEILNRPIFEGVSMTIDFDGVSADESGRIVVKAGTPIDGDGKVVKATPWTGAVGILYKDVYVERPQGTLLTDAYVHTGRAQKSSGLTYDGALVTAMVNAGCKIRFEEPFVLGSD